MKAVIYASKGKVYGDRELMASILSEQGFLSHEYRASLIHRGLLSRVYEFTTTLDRGLHRQLVLKLHTVDLKRGFESIDALSGIPNLLPVPPFFSSTRDLIERAQSRLDIRLPRVLDEGSIDGFSYTLMDRVDGIRWPHPVGQKVDAEFSHKMGELARNLHQPIPLGRRVPGSVEWSARLVCVARDLAQELPFPTRKLRGLMLAADRFLKHFSECPAFIHGDLHPCNCLFNEMGDIVGLVDFQLSFLGPKWVEFRCLPAFDTESFMKGYGADLPPKHCLEWVGNFFEALFEALAMVIAACLIPHQKERVMRAYHDQFFRLLDALESEPM